MGRGTALAVPRGTFSTTEDAEETATTEEETPTTSGASLRVPGVLRGGKFQPRDCRAQVRRRIIPEALDERMPFERGLDHPALDASTAAVNEPDLAETGCGRRLEVIVDHGNDVARGERVQVELGFNRYADRIVR